MTDAKQTTIDPEGDVLLEFLAADNKVHLLVSSKALSLASPVFNKMFKSCFKEGSGTPRSPSQPLVIPLNDDDLEAMTVLCNAIHHRMAEVPGSLSAASLEKVTIAVDKYDLTTGIRHSSIVWLQAGFGEYAPGDYVKLLFAAYVLDEPAAFAKISWEIVYGQKELLALPAKPVEHDLVAHKLLDMLEARRAGLDTVMAEAIEQCMPPTILKCPTASNTVVPFLKALDSQGLWPPMKALRDMTISEAVTKSAAVDDVHLTPCITSRARRCFYCGDAPWSDQDRLRSARERI